MTRQRGRPKKWEMTRRRGRPKKWQNQSQEACATLRRLKNIKTKFCTKILDIQLRAEQTAPYQIDNIYVYVIALGEPNLSSNPASLSISLASLISFQSGTVGLCWTKGCKITIFRFEKKSAQLVISAYHQWPAFESWTIQLSSNFEGLKFCNPLV